MFHKEVERVIERLEEQFERELREYEANFRRKYKRRHQRGESLLFEFEFDNIKILQPMDVTKKIGAFTGTLVFKDAEGDVLDISKVSGLTLVADDATVGNVTLDPATGKFSGSGIAVGKLTLTASLTNDAGNVITGTSSITFAGDTTVTSVDVNID